MTVRHQFQLILIEIGVGQKKKKKKKKSPIFGAGMKKERIKTAKEAVSVRNTRTKTSGC
jgi:hypothetical protein